jgi:serine/threonine-protein kinase HipA
MYDVPPILDEGPALTLSISVGLNEKAISRLNLLGHHQHFALAKDAAIEILDRVASWEEALKEHYAQHLRGLS